MRMEGQNARSNPVLWLDSGSPSASTFQTVHMDGTYELEAVDRLIKPGFACDDLGARIGLISLLMAHKAKHEYAFEPAPARRNPPSDGRERFREFHDHWRSNQRAAHSKARKKP